MMISSYMTHDDGPEITISGIDEYPEMTAVEGDWLVEENGYMWVYKPQVFKELFEYEAPSTL